MNPLQQLALLVEALHGASVHDKAFFAPVASFIARLQTILSIHRNALKKHELLFLGQKIEDFFVSFRPAGTAFYIPPASASNNDKTVSEILALAKSLNAYPNADFDRILREFQTDAVPPNLPASRKAKSTCVFIGHGRSKVWLLVKDYVEKELGLPVVAYESEPRAGESIVPILEKMLDQATFAVIVMTAEDATPSGSKRARQNVVHEAGLFQGRLGFSKAIVLLQRGCDDFSNIDGLQYLAFTEENIHEAFYGLQKTLKREKQC